MPRRVGGEGEYEGVGVGPNTIHTKPEDALDNGDKVRLVYLTGQEVDTDAPRDESFFYGGDNGQYYEISPPEHGRAPI